MTDVIEFLERMGRDAQLRHAPEAVLEQALRDTGLSPRARAALTRGDRAEIEAVIGAENNVCCVIYAPEPDVKETQPHGPKAASVEDNVCCMIFAPEDGEEEQPKSPKGVVGIDEKVCCVVFAPSEGEDESDGDEQQRAA